MGGLYLAAAVALGAWMMLLSVRLAPRTSMRFFGYSNLYLAVLFIAMAVDRLVA